MHFSCAKRSAVMNVKDSACCGRDDAEYEVQWYWHDEYEGQWYWHDECRGQWYWHDEYGGQWYWHDMMRYLQSGTFKIKNILSKLCNS